MADIDITCPSCATVMTVSEFIEADNITCRNCGTKLHKPTTGLKLTARQKPTVKASMVDETKKEEVPAQEWRFHKNTHKDDSELKKPAVSSNLVLSWILFFLLATCMGIMRYGHIVPLDYLDQLKIYSPFILFCFHIIIILIAFKYSVFQGTLGILFPPYPYFFLFTVCDAFYLRAVVAGFLVGIGQDSFIYFRSLSIQIFEVVTKWIASGG